MWHSPLTRKLEVFVELTPEDRAFLRELESNAVPVGAHAQLVVQEELWDDCYVLSDGWAMKYKSFEDGRRQVVDFVLPGDFVALQANVFRVADHSVSMLSDGTASRFEPERVTELFARFPKLAAAIVWTTACQESILAERIASLGRRSAYERVAHILVELWSRLRIRGLTDSDSFAMPVTQSLLADALGLSVVHVNRTLRRLRNDGLIRRESRSVTILDFPGLNRVAGFEDDYLHHTGIPRRMSRELERFTTCSGSEPVAR